MLNFKPDMKIYVCTGYTDMRKGANSLSMLAESILAKKVCSGALFVFRGKSADKIKLLWWDGQGFLCEALHKKPYAKKVIMQSNRPNSAMYNKFTAFYFA